MGLDDKNERVPNDACNIPIDPELLLMDDFTIPDESAQDAGQPP